MARILTGVVTSSKTDKTIIVTIQTRKTHPVYKKQYTVSKKFMAHDEKNEAETGDKVSIVECRPMSARKSFALKTILERGGKKFEATDSAAHIDEPAQNGEEA